MRKPKAQVYQDKAGGWRWRLRSGNNRIIAESGEAYSERRKAIEALDRMGQVAVYEAFTNAADEARQG